MTTDEYLDWILERYSVVVDTNFVQSAIAYFTQILAPSCNNCIEEIYLSGSCAKGTVTSITSDIDLFVSFSTTSSPEELFSHCESIFKSKNLVFRRQNVSFGLTYNTRSVDIVPAKKHSGNTNYHWLYSSKNDCRIQTNVVKQIQHVKDSGRIKEIKLLKIWAKLHNLDFPSIYIELFTIKILNGRLTSATADNFLYLLGAIRDNLSYTRVEDPSNSGNIVSESLTESEKKVISAKAREMLDNKTWGQVIW